MKLTGKANWTPKAWYFGISLTVLERRVHASIGLGPASVYVDLA